MASDSGLRITGSVAADGEPLSGAVVELLPADDPYPDDQVRFAGGDPPEPLARTLSDGHGLYRLAAPTIGFYRLRIEADGRVAHETPLHPLLDPIALPSVELTAALGIAPEEAKADEPGPLADAATISGAIVDLASGRPIADALVWVVDEDWTLSDRGGGFRLSGRSTGPRHLRVAAEGFVETTRRIAAYRQVEAPGPTIALQPAGTVSGRVVDADRRPLADVEVEVRVDAAGMNALISRGRMGRAMHRKTLTDPEGRFALRRVLADHGLDLRLTRDDYRPETRHLAALSPFERHEVEVVLRPARGGFGLVVDAADEPIADAEIALRVDVLGPQPLAPPLTATTGSDGRFVLPNLYPNRFLLSAKASGFAPVTVSGIVVPESADAFDLGTVVLLPGASIHGRVVDRAGEPIAGARVHTVASQPHFMRPDWILASVGDPTGNEAVRSDAEGRFEIADLQPGGDLVVVAIADGFLPEIALGVAADEAEPVLLSMQASATLAGRVLDRRGAAIAGAQVHGYPADSTRGLPVRPTHSDAQGYFEISGLQPGRLVLAVEAAGFVAKRLNDLEIISGQRLDEVEIRLDGAAIVHGTVRDEAGSPVADARMAVIGDERFFGGQVFTDGEGRYRFDTIPAGGWTVSAEHPHHAGASRQIDVTVPGRHRVDLELAAGVPVAGRVVSSGGTGVAEAEVTLVGPYGIHTALKTHSGAGGVFRFDRVPPKLYEAFARKEGWANRGLQKLEVMAGEPVEDLELVLFYGVTLRGRVLGLAPDALASVGVGARSEHGQGRGRVDFEGGYEIPGLAPGEWWVHADDPGSGRQVTERVTVTEGAGPIFLDLEFRDGFALDGRARFAGQPIRYAQLTLYGPDGGYSRVASNDDGAFRFAGLESGTHILRLSDLGRSLRYRRELEITGDTEVAIDLDGAVVAGTVVDGATGEPLVDARLRFVVEPRSRPETWPSNGSTSDANGHFYLGEVPAGSWLLEATRAGYAPARTVLHVVAGSPQEDLRIVLVPP